MKKLKLLSLLLAAVFVLIFVGFVIGGEKNAAPSVSLAYDFPIKSGTDARKKLASHSEMPASTQIPPDVLIGMSTRALVETCLNYPMFGDMMAYNDLQEGLDAVISGFNGL